jgi:hypothetical protein
MPPIDRDTSKQTDSPDDTPRDSSAASSSNTDADDSAAHIAELVRRTTERHNRRDPSSTARADVTSPQPPIPAAPLTPQVAQPVTQQFAQPVEQPVTQQFAQPVEQPVTQQFAQPVEQPVTQQFAQPVEQPVTQQFAQPVEQPVTQQFAQPVEQPVSQPARPAIHRPSLPVLVAVGVVAVGLIVGGFVLSRPASSHSNSTLPTAGSSAPAAYAVKVTDVITDCASHSHGQTKSSFRAENCVKATRFLATGQVSGRPTVFVVSRIQMASPDAAASVKQVLDATDTGNLNDLLREGRTFPGAPNTMPDSGYASVQTGMIVVVAEAGFVHGPSSNTNPALRTAAARVATLVTAQN